MPAGYDMKTIIEIEQEYYAHDDLSLIMGSITMANESVDFYIRKNYENIFTLRVHYGLLSTIILDFDYSRFTERDYYNRTMIEWLQTHILYFLKKFKVMEKNRELALQGIF